jgi:SnoaL-like domain
MAMTALDYEEIRQLIARYSQALDFQDLDTFVETFAPDGAFHSNSIRPGVSGIHTGRDALRAFAVAVGEGSLGHSHHNPTNTLIEGDGETAKSTSYCITTHDYGVLPKGTKGPYAGVGRTGYYMDDLVKLDGRWYFQARKYRYDGDPQSMPRRGDPLLVGRVFNK